MSVESSSPSSYSLSPPPPPSSSSPSSNVKGEQSNVQQQQSSANSSVDLSEISETIDSDDLITQRNQTKDPNKSMMIEPSQVKKARQAQNGVYNCPFCELTFVNNNGMTVHMRSKHPERLPYYCMVKDCSYLSLDPLPVRLHIENKHEIAYQQSRDYVGWRLGPILWPKCPQCGRILNEQNELQTHLLSHTKPGHRCKWEGCGEFYGHTSQAIKHVKKVHFVNDPQFEKREERDFLEMIGTKSTNHKVVKKQGKSKIREPKHRLTKSWSSLSSSAKQSNGQLENNNTIDCSDDWIEINDTDSDDLLIENNQNKDLNSSTTEPTKAKKPRQKVLHGRYKCCFCVATFEKSNKSTVHMRTEHSELMPYYCKMADCEYITVLQQALRWHVERKHGIKPNEAENYFGTHEDRVTRALPCPQCNRQINGFESLVKHLGAHNKAGYRCKFSGCGYFFSLPTLVEKHVKKDHFKKDSKLARCNAKGYFECVKPNSSHKAEAINPVKTVKTKHPSPISNGGKLKSDKPKSNKPKPNKSKPNKSKPKKPKPNKPKPNKPKPNNRKPVSKVPPPKNKEPQLCFLENGSPMSLLTLHLFRHKTKLKSYRTVPVAGIRESAPFELMADAFIAFENHRKLLDPDYEQQPLTPISTASSVAALSDAAADADENSPTFKGRPARNKTKRHMKDNVLTVPPKKGKLVNSETEPTDDVALVKGNEQGDEDEVELMDVDDVDSSIAPIRQDKYQCCICINKTFNNSQSRNTHYRSEHHQLMPFYCKESHCTYASFQAGRCRKHIKITHSIGEGHEMKTILGFRPTVNCVCKHCSRKFYKFRELKDHFDSHYTYLVNKEMGLDISSDLTSSASQSIQTIDTNGKAKSHNNESQSTNLTAASEEHFSLNQICYLCDQVYGNSRSLHEHYRSAHHGVFYCMWPLCPFASFQSNLAINHVKNFHLSAYSAPLKAENYIGDSSVGDRTCSQLTLTQSKSVKSTTTTAASSYAEECFTESSSQTLNPQTNTSTTNATGVSADISQAMPPNQAIHKCSLCTEEFSSTRAKNDHDGAMHPETVPFYCKWTGENTPCSFVSFIPQTIKAHIQKDHKVEHNAAAAVYVGTRLAVDRTRPEMAKPNPGKSPTSSTSTLSTSASPSTSTTNATVAAHIVECPTESSQLNPQSNTTTTARHTTNAANVPANISQVMIPAMQSNSAIHKCDICSEEFPSERAKIGHNFSMHPEETYYCKCGYCPFTAARPEMIKEHIKSEHPAENDPTPDKDYVCCECGREMISLYQLRLHLKSHSDAAKELLQGYCCIWEGCNFFYASIAEAKQHVKKDHLLGDPVQLAMFDPEEHLEKFVPKISTTTATASPVELINPVHSTTTATRASSMTNQTNIVSATNSPNGSSSNIYPMLKLALTNPVKSNTSNTGTASSYIIHYAAKSNRNLNPKTNKPTATINSTNASANISREILAKRYIYKCAICNLRFSSASSLTAHERNNHPETRPFFCKFNKCSYVAFKSNHLTKHIKKQHSFEHDEAVSYVGARYVAGRSCPTCFRIFESKQALAVHLPTHSRKSYRCTLCGFICSGLSENLINHAKYHIKSDPVQFAQLDLKEIFELVVPNSATPTATLARVSNQFPAPTSLTNAALVPDPYQISTPTSSATATTIPVPEPTYSHTVKKIICPKRSLKNYHPVTQRILTPSSLKRVDTETLSPASNSSSTVVSSLNNNFENNNLLKQQQQQIPLTSQHLITQPTLFYITPGPLTSSNLTLVVNNFVHPIVNYVHNSISTNVPSATVSTAAAVCSTQSSLEADLETSERSEEIVEATEQSENFMELINDSLQGQPENTVNEDNLNENNNNNSDDLLNQLTSNDAQIRGHDDEMDYEEGDVKEVGIEEQDEKEVEVVRVGQVEEEKSIESQSTTTVQNVQQKESVHENMDYEDDELLEEELEIEEEENEEGNEKDDLEKVEKLEEIETVEIPSTSSVPSVQQSATSVQQHDPFCFECHKKVSPLQAIQHCSLCPLTYHLECIESADLFTKQQLAIERYEALEQKPQDDDINKLLTLHGVCDECVLKIVGKHYNRSNDGFSVESGVFKKDVETTYHNIANLLINKAKNWKFRGWKKLFKTSEASKTIFKEMDLDTIATKENKYESLDELLFDVKLIVHNRTISNHRCPYTVDCLAQLMGYAKTEAEHIRLCDSCNRLYYKETNLPKKIYQGDTPYGEVFQMGCQNPHTVVWVRIDGEWWPAKVFRKYTECLWEASLDLVQVVTFGPQKFHTVEPCKLYNYSRKVPENGQIKTEDQHDAVEEAEFYLKTLDPNFFECTRPEIARRYERGNLYINTKQDANQLPIADPNDTAGKSISWKCQSCRKRLTDSRVDLCTVSFCNAKCKKVFLGRSRK